MLSILFVRLTIKVKVGIPESFKVGWYPPKKTGSSHLKLKGLFECLRLIHKYALILLFHLKSWFPEKLNYATRCTCL